MTIEGMRIPHLPTPDCWDILPLVIAEPATGFRHNPLLPIALQSSWSHPLWSPELL